MVHLRACDEGEESKVVFQPLLKRKKNVFFFFQTMATKFLSQPPYTFLQ